MDINDKTYRKLLIEKYLDADTTLSEERMLQEYFRTTPADKEEEAFAGLLAASPLAEITMDEKLSYDGEYDRMMSELSRSAGKSARRRVYAFVSAFSAVAAALALFFFLRVARQDGDNENSFSPAEIVECLGTLSEMDIFDMDSMTAVPLGQEIEVTIRLKNGRSVSYLMSKNMKDGTVRMTALNNL